MNADAIIEELCQPWRHGEHFDGCDLVFDEPLVLDGLTIRSFDFSMVTLRAGLSARNADFSGMAWLRHARISGPCDFSGALFRNDLRADGLHADKISMSGGCFQGVLSLYQAELDDLLLDDALVLANLNLEQAQIIGTTDLSRAEIMGGLAAAGAHVGRFLDTGANISGRIHLPD